MWRPRTRRRAEPTPAGASTAYDELRTTFTAAVSHELRTPLARVLALLDTALLPGSDVEQLLEQARREIEQASELIDEVLFLSELEADAGAVAFGSTAVAPVAADVFSTLRERAELAGVDLRADLSLSFELPLRRRLVRIVVENLAENAIRHAGSGAVFVLTGAVEADRLVLSAVDDGVGVDRGDLPRLLERFFRADPVRGSEGSGLGLAIVKHIVAAAGGDVRLESPRRGLAVRCVCAAAP